MTKRFKDDKAATKQQPPQPVDVQEGIPDRAANPPLWRYLVLVGAFVLWVGLLASMLLTC